MSIKEDIASALFRGSFNDPPEQQEPPLTSFDVHRWYIGDERSPVEKLIVPDSVKTCGTCQCPDKHIPGECDGCGFPLLNNPGIPDGVGYQSQQRCSRHGYLELCVDCYRKSYKLRYPDLPPPL